MWFHKSGEFPYQMTKYEVLMKDGALLNHLLNRC
jgi:hypothetical protein